MVQLWLRSIMWQIRKIGSFIWNRANTKFLIWQLPSVNRSILMKHLLRLWSNVTLHRVKNDLPQHCMNFLINIAGSGMIASPALMFSREVATTRCIVQHFVQNWDQKNPTITWVWYFTATYFNLEDEDFASYLIAAEIFLNFPLNSM